MSQPPPGPDRERAFTSLYEVVYGDLIRFVQRRDDSGHAEDVVAEALLTVWRRLDELPPQPGDARAWAFGITRNVLLNRRRGERRRQALGVRLADATSSPDHDLQTDSVVSRVDLGRAWGRLRESDQEALGLSVFEGLTAPQAAAVLDISPVAFRLRLSRARRALRLHLDHPSPPSGAPAGVAERTTA